jgi:hypothetical protein
VEVLCTERRGDQTILRREVRIAREPALLPRLDPVTAPPIGRIMQRYHQQSGYCSNCYQTIESHYGRDYHE